MVATEASYWNAFLWLIVSQVNDIRRPRKYEDAVKDKESAREEIEVVDGMI